jgi:hypothetical protein
MQWVKGLSADPVVVSLHLWIRQISRWRSLEHGHNREDN